MLILTHSGTFHADDVFASVVLEAALGDVTLVRSREAEAIAAADLVFDVGGVYDPGARRYDHHMRERPLRPDGLTPYSSVGLVWRDFGRPALARLVDGLRADEVEPLWAAIDTSLVLPIDLADNGVAPVGPGHLSLLVEAFNPAWDGPQHFDEAFGDAAAFARGVVARACREAIAEIRAAALVQAAAGAAADPRILVLDRKLPWEKAVHEGGLDEALFVIYPNEGATAWYCKTVPPEPGSFGQRLGLPDAWRGLQDEAFRRASGVEDGLFCHPAGFICGARSRESTVALAREAIRLGGA
ncbi:MYG1 family protein [Salinarimonas soli]|uniref:MYG1 family protein n=1 Tax=Salinarimonas soli TaxID=1638099 RepID=A0A5B2V892_9HYPH|nr:MYG1 family protein [Salinarimonas soli]KAA2234968.1 MYG1 family protein [Salinarimonas soli]